MIGRILPEGEGSIDRRMHFIPVTPPIQVRYCDYPFISAKDI